MVNIKLVNRGLKPTNKVVTDLLSKARQRSRKFDLPFNITKDDIKIPDFCPVLGIPLYRTNAVSGDNSPTIDRIVPGLGYVKGNILVVSNRANRIKSNALMWELDRVSEFYVSHISHEFFKLEPCGKHRKLNDET